MLELAQLKVVPTGVSCSEEDWEKLNLLFNEGEDLGEIDIDINDMEAWLELKEYNKKLHDALQDMIEEGTGNLIITALE